MVKQKMHAGKSQKQPSSRGSKPADMLEKEQEAGSVTQDASLPEAQTGIIKLPPAWKIAAQALRTVWARRWVFLGIMALFGILNAVLLQVANEAVSIPVVRDLIETGSAEPLSDLEVDIAVFSILVTALGGSSSDIVLAYQGFMLLIFSLAIIWALRAAMAGEKVVRVRDSFYKGMYPLVPFFLVLLVIGLQLIPALAATAVYTIVTTGEIAVSMLEHGLWLLLLIAGTLLSLYLLTTSVVAAYAVTLPDMTPINSLRSARELVIYRRWPVLRKLLFLPLLLLLIAAVMLLPIIIFSIGAAYWAWFIFFALSLVIFHAYLYALYRELLV